MKIKVDKIKIPEERARSRWTPEQKAFLKAGMQKYGQLSDILVRPLGNGFYELIDGESRLLQLIEEGKTSVDCQVAKLDDRDSCIVNMMMNVARGEQDPMGMALALSKSIEAGMDKDEIAIATGHTAQWVDFMLQLNDLPEVYQTALRENRLKVTHIREALKLPNPKELDAALSAAMTFGWKTTDMANYVANRMREYAVVEAVKRKTGISSPPPAPEPQELVRYAQCLVCGEMVENQNMNLPRQCTDCYSFSKYAVNVCGKGDEGMQKLFKALEMLESFDQQRRMFLAQEEAKKTAPAPQQDFIPNEAPILENQDSIIKPDKMTAEEWEALKRALAKSD